MASKKVEVEIVAKDKTGKATKSAEKNITALGNVARTIGPLVTAAFGAAVIRESVRAFIRQEAAIAQLEQRIKSTGGAAGFTSEELQRMASGLQDVTTFGDEATIEMQALLLTFTQIQGPVFERAQESILNVATAMGTDLKSAAIQVGKALNDPKGQLSALSRSGIQFTEDQKDMIKTMQEAGDVAGAQAVILKELETQFGGAARAARDTFGGALTAAGNSIGDLSEKFAEAIIGFTGFTGILKDATFLIDELNRALSDTPFAEKLGEANLEIFKMEQAIKAAREEATKDGGFLDSIFGIDPESPISDINIMIAQLAELKRKRDAIQAEAPAEEAATLTEAAEVDPNIATERFREQQTALTDITRFEKEQRVLLAIEEGQQITDVWQLSADERIAADNRAIESQLQNERDLAAAQIQLRQNVASISVNLLDALFIFTGSKNKALFEAGKVASIASAIVNTHVGATKALAQGGIFGAVGAAAVVAQGLAQVARIKATTLGGGSGGGGGISLGGTGTFGQPAAIGQPQPTAAEPDGGFTIIFEGDFIGDEQLIEDKIIPAINAATGRGVTLEVRG